MGCSEANVKTLNYRGDGWPGYTTASTEDKEYKMSYMDSWGKILGRDTRKFCRFCLDGIGEMADISCGDYWYLDKGRPDFSEHSDGRNIIFARTSKGEEILTEIKENILHLEKLNRLDDLFLVQAPQCERKATIFTKILALKLIHKPIPFFNLSDLRGYASYAKVKVHFRYFLGMIKRYLIRSI